MGSSPVADQPADDKDSARPRLIGKNWDCTDFRSTAAAHHRAHEWHRREGNCGNREAVHRTFHETVPLDQPADECCVDDSVHDTDHEVHRAADDVLHSETRVRNDHAADHLRKIHFRTTPTMVITTAAST